MSLEDYSFPIYKRCPNFSNNRKCSLYKHEREAIYCGSCGSKLDEYGAPLGIKIHIHQFKKSEEILMDLDDFISLLKSRWLLKGEK